MPPQRFNERKRTYSNSTNASSPPAQRWQDEYRQLRRPHDAVASQSPTRGGSEFASQGPLFPAAADTCAELRPATYAQQTYSPYGDWYAYPQFYQRSQQYAYSNFYQPVEQYGYPYAYQPAQQHAYPQAYYPAFQYPPQQQWLMQPYDPAANTANAQCSDEEDGGVPIAPSGDVSDMDAAMAQVRQYQARMMGMNALTHPMWQPQAMSTLAIHPSPEKKRKQKQNEKKGSDPKLYLLKRPIPTEAYRKRTLLKSITLSAPRSLLVVLDLNGTLLHRKKAGSTVFTARPKVKEFMQYLLKHHSVMVWSSAQPKNVDTMCRQLLTEEEMANLVAVWARDMLRISPKLYNQKVQVYKQLSWVWEDHQIQMSNLAGKATWDQTNTVLIDDSAEKAASEPQNLVQLEEFKGEKAQMETDVLGQVVEYLEALKWQNNVSAFMRTSPFNYVDGDKFDWKV